MRTSKAVGILLCTCLLCSCQWMERRHQQAGTIVELEGRYLHKATLDSLTLGLEAEDSARVADEYIRQWAKDVLVESQRSKIGKARIDEIERMVEDYRRSLYVHAYEQYLIERRMPREVEDSVVEAYYEKATDRFRLNESIVKGLLLVLDKEAPKMNKLRKDLPHIEDKGKENSMDDIEKYAYKFAKGYELFTDHWMTTSELLLNLPTDRVALENELRQHNQIELSDSASIYLLQITHKCLRGDRMPLEYARPEIEQIILRGRQTEFLESERERLYDEAAREQRIVYMNDK